MLCQKKARDLALLDLLAAISSCGVTKYVGEIFVLVLDRRKSRVWHRHFAMEIRTPRLSGMSHACFSDFFNHNNTG